MGAVRFSIDSGLVRELTTKLPLKVFVETGTYEGAAVREMLPLFDELHTIELAAPFYGRAVDAFKDSHNVHVHHGRSEAVLRRLVPRLRRRSVLYWLDAHWCDERSAGDDAQCPLLEELEAIRSVSDCSVVLIDDARLFMAPPPKPAVTEGWPQFSEVLDQLSALNPEHEVLVIEDVIVFFPPQVREPLHDYAHHHAVDWLGEPQVNALVQQRLGRLGEELARLRAQTAEQQRTEEDRTQAEGVGRGLTNLTSTVSALERQVRELGERAPSKSALDALGARVEGLGAELERLGPRIDRRLEQQSNRSQAMLELLKSTRREVRALQDRLDVRERRRSLPSTRDLLHAVGIGPYDPRPGSLDHDSARELRIPRPYRRRATLLRRLRTRAGDRLDRLPAGAEKGADRRAASRKTLAIDSIVGTAEPEKGLAFDREFRPLGDTRGRWELIWIACRRGVELPPIFVYRLDGRHFVRDGHHRVSVARALGADAIDALVVELAPVTQREPGSREPGAGGNPPRDG